MTVLVEIGLNELAIVRFILAIPNLQPITWQDIKIEFSAFTPTHNL